MKFGEKATPDVRRIYLLKQSETGSEQRSEGGSGRYEEGEMGRKDHLGGP